MLAPGAYSFQFTAEGHFPKTINNVTVNNFQTTVLNVELIPNFIPVELISFAANVIGQEVQLNWQTATEINNKGYEIERTSPIPSTNQGKSGEAGTGWEIIGYVAGYGTTNKPMSYSFVDENVNPGSYQYCLKQIDFNGSFTYSDIIEVVVEAQMKFSLEQNYPNPFNPSTKISYRLPENNFVTLKVYDVLGNEITTLVNEEKSAGNYEVNFNAASLSSGIYSYKLTAGNSSEAKKMILMK
jgi:hypothetical protein